MHCIYLITHNKALSKMVYLDSRRFLPSTSPLRSDNTHFPSKSKEDRSKPSLRTFAEVKDNHEAYDNVVNKYVLKSKFIQCAFSLHGSYCLNM